MVIIVTPVVHHFSHFFPVLGHLITTIILSLILGSIYSKANTGTKVGCLAGFFLLLVRLLIHYAVVIVGIMIFANKLFSDLSSIF